MNKHYTVTLKPASKSVPTTTVSPAMAVDLRMKNLEQLRYAKQLLDDGILSETEFAEQKENILLTIKKLWQVTAWTSCT